ncbi:MAG: D-2-hydroxyacid dehydrogenase [Chloroflexota bacterium]
MSHQNFPDKTQLTIYFAHSAYALATAFEKRGTGINYFQAWSREVLNERIPEADVLVISGFWNNALLEKATRLKFIQSVGAGYNQFPQDQLRERGIRLASARGVNKNAVSEHAMAHILSLTRHIHTGRDHQHNRFWRDMIGEIPQREDELEGKTLLIIGFGGIGSRLAKLAKAFDMRVLATKRNPATAEGPADEVHTNDQLPSLLPQADFVALTCPLTPETKNLINHKSLGLMKPSAYLINMARGYVVNEPDLIEALEQGQIAGAGLDTFWEEPLGEESPLWGMQNVIITPHTGGETQKYEENLMDILLDNIERLTQGNSLRNQVI